MINEHILKLSGKVSLPSALTLGKTYHLDIEGDITKQEDEDNQDGTINRSFKFTPLTCDVINEKGERMKTKDKNRLSQKLRARAHIYGVENNEDDVYDRYIPQIIRNFDEVIKLCSIKN